MSPSERWRYLYPKPNKASPQRLYVRVPGTTMIRLYPPQGVRVADYLASPDHAPGLALAYGQAVAEARARANGEKRGRGSAGSFDWLLGLYYASPEFKSLGETTQRRRKSLLDEFSDDRPAPSRTNPHPAPFGQQPAEKITRKLLRGMMGRWQEPKPEHPNPKARAGGIEAANNRLRAQRALWKWANEPGVEHVEHNPARDVKLLESESTGFHSWTKEEIGQFFTFWGPGTAPCVAMMVMLCTGTRRSDAWRIGPPMVKDGAGGPRVTFTPFKTRKPRKGKPPVAVSIPMLRVLTVTLERGPTSATHFIVGERGRPFQSAASFGNVFSEWCNRAGLPHCSAHGIRKGGAAWLAELGLTPFQLNSIYAWTGINMAQLYTDAADRRIQGDALRVLDEAVAKALAIDIATVPGIEADALDPVEDGDGREES